MAVSPQIKARYGRLQLHAVDNIHLKVFFAIGRGIV